MIVHNGVRIKCRRIFLGKYCREIAEILGERQPKNLLTCLFVRRHFAEVAQG